MWHAGWLQLNHAKSEVLWCSSTCRQHQIPSRAVHMGNTAVQRVSAVRDLGIMLDAEVTMSTHVSAVVKASFAALRQICSVRHSIPCCALLTLIFQALVISKVDYCNSVLAGVSDTLLRRLQSILNASTRLVFLARKYEHITPLLCELQWLRVPEKIKFRLCVLVSDVFVVQRHGTSPRPCIWQPAAVPAVSAATSTLIVPATRWRTLGDCVFPVAAAHAWNSLPSFVRDQQSLAAFSTTTEDNSFQDILCRGW